MFCSTNDRPLRPPIRINLVVVMSLCTCVRLTTAAPNGDQSAVPASPAKQQAGELRVSLGTTPLGDQNTVAVDLALDDGRYLPLEVVVEEDRQAVVQVEVPDAWKPQIGVWREDRGADRYQLVPLSDRPVSLRRGEPLVLWIDSHLLALQALTPQEKQQVRRSGRTCLPASLQHLFDYDQSTAPARYYQRASKPTLAPWRNAPLLETTANPLSGVSVKSS